MKTQKKNEKYLFEEASVPRALAVMALPAIVSQLITLIYNLADTWFIGRTNNPYMVASCSLVLPMYMLTVVISNVFGVGGGTLIARLIGRGEDTEASKVSAACVRMSLISSVVYSILCFAAMTPVLRLLGASDAVLGYAKQYMFFVVVIGGIPVLLNNTLSSMLRSIGLSSEASFGLSMGGVLNIALDPLFMFVILPDGQQVMGAAIATMLSNMAALVYFVIIYRKECSRTILRFRLKGEKLSSGSLLSIFSVGLPAATSLLLFDACMTVINRLSAGHGDIELAAIGIVLKTERLPLNIGIGICLGMVPLLAYSYSSGNIRRMDAVFRFGRGVGLLIGIVSVIRGPDHARLHRGCRYGAVRNAVPTCEMLRDTAHVRVLFHGSFYTGDRAGKGVFLAGCDPAAGIQYSDAVSSEPAVWDDGNCLDAGDRRPLYGHCLVYHLCQDPPAGGVASGDLKPDRYGSLPSKPPAKSPGRIRSFPLAAKSCLPRDSLLYCRKNAAGVSGNAGQDMKTPGRT